MLSLAIGNGESRSGIDLDKIPKDITVGCNAVIRDFAVDHLVCVDRRMVREALNYFDQPIYTRPDWIKEFKQHPRVKLVPDLPYAGNTRADDPFHWGSGPYAVLLAASISDTVSLIGFDLWSKDRHINNLYKGTDNYNHADHRAIDPRYWIHQISMVFKHHPDKYFVVYNEKDWKIPEQWHLANVSFKGLDLLRQ